MFSPRQARASASPAHTSAHERTRACVRTRERSRSGGQLPLRHGHRHGAGGQQQRFPPRPQVRPDAQAHTRCQGLTRIPFPVVVTEPNSPIVCASARARICLRAPVRRGMRTAACARMRAPVYGKHDFVPGWVCMRARLRVCVSARSCGLCQFLNMIKKLQKKDGFEVPFFI